MLNYRRLGDADGKLDAWASDWSPHMFSMKKVSRAVDLYFTEGMTIRKVIAELGYPSEGALVKWVRDPRYTTGACRRSYTLECKTNAARRALEGEPLARAGARRGLHADERVPVDAPLPERGDAGTDGQEKRADAGRTDARGRR